MHVETDKETKDARYNIQKWQNTIAVGCIKINEPLN